MRVLCYTINLFPSHHALEEVWSTLYDALNREYQVDANPEAANEQIGPYMSHGECIS
jgi:hypothetical protein